eukprot:6887407-Pyramimonas_sp.AAC.1
MRPRILKVFKPALRAGGGFTLLSPTSSSWARLPLSGLVAASQLRRFRWRQERFRAHDLQLVTPW